LVVDLRLFETRSVNPAYATLESLSFFVNTDGRRVTANQWLATLATRVTNSFVAAIAYKTIQVEGGVARFEWVHRSRRFQVEIDLSGYHPSAKFQTAFQVTSKRGDETLRHFTKSVELEVGKTTFWSARELEIGLRDYLSNFRGYRDTEHRGLLFEKLQSRSVHLILVATPRLLAESEINQLTPEELHRPPGQSVPELDNPLGAPLSGTVTVGFEIDPSGAPFNPQIVWSTVPEVNPRILGAVAKWRFPPPEGATPGRRWGLVAIPVEIP
jgi:hypothetical protein